MADREKVNFPQLDWHEFQTRTEEELNQYLKDNAGWAYLVLLRQKYEYEAEKDWEYLIEFISPQSSDGDDYIWDNDWWEGQQCVEYFGIARIVLYKFQIDEIEGGE